MVHYDPLAPERPEIRLLALQPGKPGDALSGTLQTVSLDDEPDYEALSYVWGDASDQKPVTVNGTQLSVTKNLEAALQALRHARKVRTLWIDAICINQVDVAEKNTQVPQMSRVYSIAKSVLVWLGPSTRNMELAISWVRTYVAKEYTAASAYWLKLDTKAAFSDKAKRDKCQTTLRALDGFLDFFALPYWNRMWTFQEYQLPHHEPVCICGEILFAARAILGDAEVAIHDAGYSALRTLSEARFLDAEPKWNNGSEYEKPFADGLLLNTTADRRCFDQRDKFFALYGMVPAIQEFYPTDYNKPFSDVMLEAAVFMIRQERGPSMWSLFGLRSERLSDTSLPSWLPDLTDARPSGLNMHRDVEKQLVESLRQRDKAPPTLVTEDLKTLHLWARSLGECKVVTQFAADPPQVLQQIQSILEEGSSSLFDNSTGHIRKPESFSTRMAYACVVHQIRHSESKADDIRDTFSQMTQLSVTGGGCRHLIVNAVQLLVGKTLLVTQNGCFAIGVGDIKTGDVLTIPPQARIPMAIRAVSSASQGEVERYQMVGTAYVDGIYEGEALDADLVSEIQQLPVEGFLIL